MLPLGRSPSELLFFPASQVPEMVDQEQEKTWAADSQQHGAKQRPLYNSICLVCYELGVISVNEYLASMLEPQIWSPVL